MKRFRNTNCISDKEVNSIEDFNLLHDILNPNRCTKM